MSLRIGYSMITDAEEKGLITPGKKLSVGGECFTPSDVERALWSSTVASKSLKPPASDDPKSEPKMPGKRKR